jgi:hypothetical protein
VLALKTLEASSDAEAMHALRRTGGVVGTGPLSTVLIQSACDVLSHWLID